MTLGSHDLHASEFALSLSERCFRHENSQATDFNKHEKRQIFYTQIFYRDFLCCCLSFRLEADYEVIIFCSIDKLSHDDNISNLDYRCVSTTTTTPDAQKSIGNRRRTHMMTQNNESSDDEARLSYQIQSRGIKGCFMFNEHLLIIFQFMYRDTCFTRLFLATQRPFSISHL